jgi:glycosyltransferase involved in cell wall biosynthesis
MKLSIIIPAHNEEDNIAEVVRKVESTVSIDHELVVVNDHSMDRTEEIVLGLMPQYGNLRLVSNRRPGCFANAVRAGFENASGDVLIPVMGDRCDDLETIPLLWEKINAGFDVACGSRYMENGERLGGPKLKGSLSRFAGRSLHVLLGIPTHDIANAFKMYRRSVIEKIDIKTKGFDISMEITLKAFFLGSKIAEVPTVWRERTKGKSSFSVCKLLPGYVKLYAWALLRKMTG